MPFTNPVSDPNGPASTARTSWGNMETRYLKVGYTGTTLLEDSGWFNTADMEYLELTVRGAGALDGFSIFGAGSKEDGSKPDAAEVLFIIGPEIVTDVHQFIEPAPEWTKIARTSQTGVAVTATLNCFLKAMKTGSR